MPKYVMALDATKCINCKACMLACQQRNFVPLNYNRNWVHKNTGDQASGFYYQPGGCMHCDNPICVDACPTHATTKDADGVVRVNTKLCIGCSSCIVACPYGARYKDPTLGVVDKCDYCSSSLAQGSEPACVSCCPTHVRVFGDANDPNSAVSQLLLANEQIKIVGKGVDTKPSLVYVAKTEPIDWPSEAKEPLPLSLMGYVGTGVRWFGALSLLGVIGVFIKQIFLPSDDEVHNDHKSDEV